jgi:hypothetical protein
MFNAGEDLNAASAAFRVGYQDASHFSREYKKHFGAPPHGDIASLRSRLDVLKDELESTSPVREIKSCVPVFQLTLSRLGAHYAAEPSLARSYLSLSGITRTTWNQQLLPRSR